MDAKEDYKVQSKTGAQGTKRLLLFSGHTGGHLFPAVSFAEVFKKDFPDSEIYLVTSVKGRAFLNHRYSHLFSQVYYLDAFPFSSRLDLDLVLFPFRLLRGFFQTWKILTALKPGLSIGFGSYVSYPGLRISRFLHIPTMMHEQNVVPGKATLTLLKYADIVCSSFPNTFMGQGKQGERVTGLPLRSDILSSGGYPTRITRKPEKNTLRLLITGGSQGAHRINVFLLEALAKLSEVNRSQLVIRHLAGKDDAPWVQEQYSKLKINAQVYSFFDKMSQLFLDSDLAVSRAGANTLFELAFFGLPAMLIPYRFAGNHQKDNALYFRNAAACFFADEMQLNTEEFCTLIRKLLCEPKVLEPMSEKMWRLAKPEAGRDLVQCAIELLKRKS